MGGGCQYIQQCRGSGGQQKGDWQKGARGWELWSNFRSLKGGWNEVLGKMS